MQPETERVVMSAEESVERARALAPAIRARAEEAEALRRIPRESIDEIVASGIGRVQRPRRWGGYELGFEPAFDVALEIGKACGSTGWATSFMNHHDWILAQFEEEAQADVWGDDPDALVASTFVPAGKVRAVDGGYLISGNWPWSSGIDHCTWAFVSGLDFSSAGEPAMKLFLVPASDYRIEDTWFNVGLRGTGSNNVVIDEETFVPEHRVVDMADLREGSGPGAKVNSAPQFNTPLLAAFALGLTAPAVGVVRGALEEWCEWTKVRTATYSAEQVAEQVPLQAKLGEAAARLDAAEHLLRADIHAIPDPARVTAVERTTSRRDGAFAMQLLVEAIDALMALSGARGLFDSNAIQRAWRDVHSIAAHTALNPAPNYIAFGRLLLDLGRAPNDRLY